jgi:hypothetical protein
MQMAGRMPGSLNEPIKRTSRASFPWPVRKANEGWEVERERERERGIGECEGKGLTDLEGRRSKEEGETEGKRER